MIAHTARIVWRTSEQGGRRTPPAGQRYSTPARFEAAKDAWPQQAWSVVLDLVSRPPGSSDWIAEVRILVDDAPQELLTEGTHFELYEGGKCVAVGTILSAVPESGQPSNIPLATNKAKVT